MRMMERATAFRRDGALHARLRSRSVKVWAALGALCIIWGSTYLAIRVAVETLPPLLMASVRFLIAGGILFTAFRGRGDREGDRPGRREWRSALILGTLLFLGGNGGVILAEQHGVASGLVALIVASVPLWIALIAFAVLRERLPPIAIIGLGIGFAGTALLIRPSGGGGFGWAMLVVAGSISWAVGTLYSRRAPLPKRPLVAAGMQLLCGGMVMGVVGIAAGELGDLHFDQFSLGSVLALGYLVLVGAVVACPCYVFLVRNAPTSTATTYAYVNPVVAVVLGWAFVDEHVSLRTLVAGAIIVAAVAMILRARSALEPGEPAAGAPELARARDIPLRATRSGGTDEAGVG